MWESISTGCQYAIKLTNWRGYITVTQLTIALRDAPGQGMYVQGSSRVRNRIPGWRFFFDELRPEHAAQTLASDQAAQTLESDRADIRFTACSTGRGFRL